MTIEELKEKYKDANSMLEFRRLTSNFIKKTITFDQLCETLTSLSETEKIYKHYHILKADLNAARTFIESADPDVLIDNCMQFPELNLIFESSRQESYFAAFQEFPFFSREHLFDIILLKHPNYSPDMRHSHSFFEALYVYQGKFVHAVNERTFEMKQGDLCILSPGVMHNVEVYDDDTVLINILIRRSTFEDVFRNSLPQNNVLSYFFLDSLYNQKKHQDDILFHTKNDLALKNLILEMLLEFENKHDFFSTVLNSKLVTFFGLLLREHGNDYVLSSKASYKDVKYYEIIHYMQEHYRDADLSSIARHFHYSNEYASRLIKKACGMNFSSFQNKLRMEQACLWLSETEVPISVVAENIGYLNVENFNRTFRKKYQQTPKEWRNAHR